MRKPRNIDAELRALQERSKQLKARKVIQLGEVVIAVGAGDLEPEVVAGLLLAALDGAAPALHAAWRERGQRLFRERTARRSASAASQLSEAGGQGPRPDAQG